MVISKRAATSRYPRLGAPATGAMLANLKSIFKIQKKLCWCQKLQYQVIMTFKEPSWQWGCLKKYVTYITFQFLWLWNMRTWLHWRAHSGECCSGRRSTQMLSVEERLWSIISNRYNFLLLEYCPPRKAAKINTSQNVTGMTLFEKLEQVQFDQVLAVNWATIKS